MEDFLFYAGEGPKTGDEGKIPVIRPLSLVKLKKEAEMKKIAQRIRKAFQRVGSFLAGLLAPQPALRPVPVRAERGGRYRK
jgi:hypothetical protein